MIRKGLLAICSAALALAGCGPVITAYTKPPYVKRVGLVVTEGQPFSYFDALPNTNPPYYRAEKPPRTTWNGAFLITRPVSDPLPGWRYHWLDAGNSFYNEFAEAAKQRMADTGTTAVVLTPDIFEGDFEGKPLRRLVSDHPEARHLDGVWVFHYSIKRGASIPLNRGALRTGQTYTTTVYQGLTPELYCIFLDLKNPSRSVAVAPKIRPVRKLDQETDEALQKRAFETLAQLVDESLGAKPAVWTAANIPTAWKHLPLSSPKLYISDVKELQKEIPADVAKEKVLSISKNLGWTITKIATHTSGTPEKLFFSRAGTKREDSVETAVILHKNDDLTAVYKLELGRTKEDIRDFPDLQRFETEFFSAIERSLSSADSSTLQ